MGRSLWAVSLVAISLTAAPASAERIPIVFGNPQVKVFALSLPFATKDDVEAYRRNAEGQTHLNMLYQWLTRNGRTGQGLLIHDRLEVFQQRVASNLRAHADAFAQDKRRGLRQVIVILKAHGTNEGLGAQSGGYWTSWDAARDAIVDARGRMDAINTQSQLVIIADVCHSGQLWKRLRSSSSMHHFAFIGSAPPDQIGTIDFAPKLLTVLKAIERQAARKAAESWLHWTPYPPPPTWRLAYEALRTQYGGWFKGKSGTYWVCPMYGDSSGDAIWQTAP